MVCTLCHCSVTLLQSPSISRTASSFTMQSITHVTIISQDRLLYGSIKLTLSLDACNTNTIFTGVLQNYRTFHAQIGELWVPNRSLRYYKPAHFNTAIRINYVSNSLYYGIDHTPSAAPTTSMRCSQPGHRHKGEPRP